MMTAKTNPHVDLDGRTLMRADVDMDQHELTLFGVIAARNPVKLAGVWA